LGSGHLGPESAVPGHVHGVNESVDVESLVFRMKTLLALAWEVLGGA
jgi:acetylornithine deacetylase/succinyl-diaminopimelate desuccinylase-like protein